MCEWPCEEGGYVEVAAVDMVGSAVGDTVTSTWSYEMSNCQYAGIRNDDVTAAGHATQWPYWGCKRDTSSGTGGSGIEKGSRKLNDREHGVGGAELGTGSVAGEVFGAAQSKWMWARVQNGGLEDRGRQMT